MKGLKRSANQRSNFPFVSGFYHLEQSLPFRTIIYCHFHEEDKVLIAEIQLPLTLTLTLIQTKINSKRRNYVEKGKQILNRKKELPCFEPMTATILIVLYPICRPQLDLVPFTFFLLYISITNGIDCCWKWQRLFQIATTLYEREISSGRTSDEVEDRSSKKKMFSPCASYIVARKAIAAYIFKCWRKVPIDVLAQHSSDSGRGVARGRGLSQSVY